VELNDECDKVVWRLDKKGEYSARSMYRFMVDPGCTDLRNVMSGTPNCC
jgi:hypothetical protein